jgi:hypothetical protein
VRKMENLSREQKIKRLDDLLSSLRWRRRQYYKYLSLYHPEPELTQNWYMDEFLEWYYDYYMES